MEEEYELENYERFLGEVKNDGGHWEKIKKRTATLFQVLMDGDLKELVFVLKHYPQYTEVVCEHFRYLYNYSGQTADIYAASKMLEISKEYHQKQFVRNLIRKLEKIEDLDISKVKLFLEELINNMERIHPIILGHYKREVTNFIERGNFHKLQVKVLEKQLEKLPTDDTFDFTAADRDAGLDIPYMN